MDKIEKLEFMKLYLVMEEKHLLVKLLMFSNNNLFKFEYIITFIMYKWNTGHFVHCVIHAILFLGFIDFALVFVIF